MTIQLPQNFSINAWYRGDRNIKVVHQDDKCIIMSNNDKFTQQGNDIYLNKHILTNMPDINAEDLARIYKYSLRKKGYKIFETKQSIRYVEEHDYQDEENDEYQFNYFDGNIEIATCSCESTCGYFLFENELTEDQYNHFFPNDRFFVVYELKVIKQYRGKGYAKKLLLKAIEKAKQLKHTQVYLNANAIEFYQGLSQYDLVQFYKRFGFKEILNQGKNSLMILNLQ